MYERAPFSLKDMLTILQDARDVAEQVRQEAAGEFYADAAARGLQRRCVQLVYALTDPDKNPNSRSDDTTVSDDNFTRRRRTPVPSSSFDPDRCYACCSQPERRSLRDRCCVTPCCEHNGNQE